MAMDAGVDALAWLQAGEGVLGLQVRFGAAFKPGRCAGAERCTGCFLLTIWFAEDGFYGLLVIWLRWGHDLGARIMPHVTILL